MHKFLIQLTKLIETRIGIACHVISETSDDFSDFYIRSSEIEYEKPHGWFVHVEVLNETLRLDFGFDQSAGLLCKFYFAKMNSPQCLIDIAGLQESFQHDFFSLSYYCDDRLVTTEEMRSIQAPLNLRIKTKGRLTRSGNLDSDLINLVLDFLYLSILPLFPDEAEERVKDFLFEVGLPEGASKKVIVNKYERYNRNLLACIKHFGTSCLVCGFDFGKVYGEFASDYIHVHHLVPVSQMSENYRVNPIQDLVPLCPNCHSAVHLSNPPLTPQELKTRLIE